MSYPASVDSLEAETLSSEADTLDEFFRNYTCELEPDFRIKLKKQVKGLRLGANLNVKNPRFQSTSQQTWAFTLRPVQKGKSLQSKLLNKITLIPSSSEVVWNMGKVHLFNFFRVKVSAGYNWQNQHPYLGWNVATKWNQDDRKSLHKCKLPVASRASLVAHLQASYGLPSMGGGIGGGRGTQEVDQGYCHLSMPKVDLVCMLDRHPKPALAPFWQGWSLPGLRQKQAHQEEELEKVTPLAADEELAAGEKQQQQGDNTHVRQSRGDASSATLPQPWGRPDPWRFPWLPEQEKDNVQLVQTEAAHLPAPWCLSNPVKFPWPTRQA